MARWRVSLWRGLMGLSLAVSLGSCGLHLPDVAKYDAGCKRFAETGDTAPDNSVFFISSRQQDCRGKAMRFANFRAEDLIHGENELDGTSREPWKHFVTHSLSQEDWLARVKGAIKRAGNGGRLLIYVHGYNNNFAIENRRAIWLSRLYYAGVPVVIVDWPSRDDLLGYMYDEDSVAWAQDYLDQLLEQLAPMADKIVIVGHSMGARAVLGAVDRFDVMHRDAAAKIGKVVLASPDIDRDQALRPGGVIERLLSAEDREMLVYASYRDHALDGSRFIHGYNRLGSSRCSFDVNYARRSGPDSSRCSLALPNPRLAIVETGEVAKGLVHHADFLDSCAVRRDLATFLREGAKKYPWRDNVKIGDLVGKTIRKGSNENCSAAEIQDVKDSQTLSALGSPP